MPGSKTIFQDFIKRINLAEPAAEITGIGHLVFEKVLALSQTDIMTDKPFLLTAEKTSVLLEIVKRINNHEPVQYILAEAFFFGRKFKVNPAVLIPRPETEELIQLTLADIATRNKASRIIDIGTGSGCLPITIKLAHKEAIVVATDVSNDALEVARENARTFNAEVHFLRHNILAEELPFQDIDIIVSNPPYIPLKEKAGMARNVTEFEPPIALFVPDDDPLIFYRAIASKAKKNLAPGGMLLVEIHEQYGSAVKSLLEYLGFRAIELHRDVSNKDRIVRGYA